MYEQDGGNVKIPVIVRACVCVRGRERKNVDLTERNSNITINAEGAVYFLVRYQGRKKNAFQIEKFLLRVTSMTRQRRPAHHMLARAEINLLICFSPAIPFKSFNVKLDPIFSALG